MHLFVVGGDGELIEGGFRGEGRHPQLPALNLRPEGGAVRALLVIHQEVGRSRPKLDGLHPQLPLRVQKVLEWIHPVVDVHRG